MATKGRDKQEKKGKHEENREKGVWLTGAGSLLFLRLGQLALQPLQLGLLVQHFSFPLHGAQGNDMLTLYAIGYHELIIKQKKNGETWT